jgi:hypothetical protein
LFADYARVCALAIIADLTPARCAPAEIPTRSSSFFLRKANQRHLGIVFRHPDEMHQPGSRQR